MLLVKPDTLSGAVLGFDTPASDLLEVPERPRDSRALRIASVLGLSIFPVVVTNNASHGSTIAEVSEVVSVSVIA
jgi:hypothetical protein